VSASLTLALDGYEGPLDALLELARAQKVDIRQISILALVDQFLAVIEGARAVRLELHAEWLVMAAWLAWLKSRLLLPEAERGPEEDPLAAAQRLTDRLEELARMRAAALWLGARAQLGRETFAARARIPCAWRTGPAFRSTCRLLRPMWRRGGRRGAPAAFTPGRASCGRWPRRWPGCSR
jgi:chromatin segregation and condensation protein Rec8/ScpA/Scc1 (kleisin family)